jgi:hypothetical protein
MGYMYQKMGMYEGRKSEKWMRVCLYVCVWIGMKERRGDERRRKRIYVDRHARIWEGKPALSCVWEMRCVRVGVCRCAGVRVSVCARACDEIFSLVRVRRELLRAVIMR